MGTHVGSTRSRLGPLSTRYTTAATNNAANALVYGWPADAASEVPVVPPMVPFISAISVLCGQKELAPVSRKKRVDETSKGKPKTQGAQTKKTEKVRLYLQGAKHSWGGAKELRAGCVEKEFAKARRVGGVSARCRLAHRLRTGRPSTCSSCRVRPLQARTVANNAGVLTKCIACVWVTSGTSPHGTLRSNPLLALWRPSLSQPAPAPLSALKTYQTRWSYTWTS
jgi:hypothetical protein